MAISARKKLQALQKLAAAKFNESDHPRYPKGHPLGGQFMNSGNEVKKVLKPDFAQNNPKTEVGLNDEIEIKTDFPQALFGRKTTTVLELSAIGADLDGDLKDLNTLLRLHTVRNGYDSYEEFLNAPPTEENPNKTRSLAGGGFPPQSFATESFLFVGKRVKMMVDSFGDVGFTIDQEFAANEDRSRPRPSEELKAMSVVFENYLNSPSSDRVLTNTPYEDTPERYQTRVKHYKNRGFINLIEREEVKGELDPDMFTPPMVLDNRSLPATFADVHLMEGLKIKGKQIKYDKPDYSDWQ